MEKLANMELRAVVPAVIAMWFVPTLDQLIRFLIPILSAIAWYYLKKLIQYLEKKYKK